MNIPDGLIRVSVGLEDADDLVADFAQALQVRMTPADRLLTTSTQDAPC